MCLLCRSEQKCVQPNGGMLITSTVVWSTEVLSLLLFKFILARILVNFF